MNNCLIIEIANKKHCIIDITEEWLSFKSRSMKQGDWHYADIIHKGNEHIPVVVVVKYTEMDSITICSFKIVRQESIKSITASFKNDF